ncbi:hypothetical protein B0H14DRAFT_3428022 [Mycena olivaceomarginata]|nr:hypothetical protein B0H14DRAFT_3428022 [Mycena olivaceomarginata]
MTDVPTVMPARAEFETPTKTKIVSASLNRCSLCLRGAICGDKQPENLKIEVGHIIEADDSRGESLIKYASRLGLVPCDFFRADASNGMPLCSFCHSRYFTSNHIVWAPNVKVLQWLLNRAHNKGSLTNWEAELRSDSAMQEYLGIYVVVWLRNFASDHVGRGKVPVPDPSPQRLACLDNAQYWDTTSGISGRVTVKMIEPKDLSGIYWRLSSTISVAAGLVAFIHRTATVAEDRPEVKLATRIHLILAQRQLENGFSSDSNATNNTVKLSDIPVSIPASPGLPTPGYQGKKGKTQIQEMRSSLAMDICSQCL